MIIKLVYVSGIPEIYILAKLVLASSLPVNDAFSSNSIE